MRFWSFTPAPGNAPSFRCRKPTVPHSDARLVSLEWPADWLGRWAQVARAADPTLLRLALLRELASDLHARKSTLPSDHASAPQLARLEPLVQIGWRASQLGFDVGSWSELERGLRQTLAKSPEAIEGPTFPDLPLVAEFGRERLVRADRRWELRLAQEAGHRGWWLWSNQAEVPLAEVSLLHERLQQRYWPRAILLFAESSRPFLSGAIWPGQWWFVAEPTWRPEPKSGHWKQAFPHAEESVRIGGCDSSSS